MEKGGGETEGERGGEREKRGEGGRAKIDGRVKGGGEALWQLIGGQVVVSRTFSVLQGNRQKRLREKRVLQVKYSVPGT